MGCTNQEKTACCMRFFSFGFLITKREKTARMENTPPTPTHRPSSALIRRFLVAVLFVAVRRQGLCRHHLLLRRWGKTEMILPRESYRPSENGRGRIDLASENDTPAQARRVRQDGAPIKRLRSSIDPQRAH